MEQDEAARIAKASGITRLLEEHPETLRAALKGAATLAARLPRNLQPAEESAHVYRLDLPAEAQR